MRVTTLGAWYFHLRRISNNPALTSPNLIGLCSTSIISSLNTMDQILQANFLWFKHFLPHRINAVQNIILIQLCQYLQNRVKHWTYGMSWLLPHPASSRPYSESSSLLVLLAVITPFALWRHAQFALRDGNGGSGNLCNSIYMLS